MPIYEYRCQDCGHELEALQFMNEDPLSECPECGRPTLKRKISAAGFRLKGGGWYETDFKKDKRRNVAADGEGKSKAEEKGETGGSKDKKADKPADSPKKPEKKAASGD